MVKQSSTSRLKANTYRDTAPLVRAFCSILDVLSSSRAYVLCPPVVRSKDTRRAGTTGSLTHFSRRDGRCTIGLWSYRAWPLVPYQAKARLQVDGSFALPIQHDEPQGPAKVNWLPAPQVGFAMTIKAVWSYARGSGTMRIVRLLEGWGLDAALAHVAAPGEAGCRPAAVCGGAPSAEEGWHRGS